MLKNTFITDSKFFFTDFHSGTVNISLHIISVIVFIYGLLYQSLLFGILGFAVFDELGHIFNYFILYKRDPFWNPLRMLPYQTLYVLPLGLILFKYFGVV